MTEAQVNTGRYEDLQSAPRFPLHLSASVKSEGAAYSAQTENISANGVLFAMERFLSARLWISQSCCQPRLWARAATYKLIAADEWCEVSRTADAAASE